MDLTRTQLNNWDVSWNAQGLGAVDKVTPNITIVTKDLKVGTIGDVVLGKRIISLTGMVTVELREIDVAQFQDLMPWFASGSILLNPATVHKDLYDYAALLTLHPTDAAAVTTSDLNLAKAVPLLRFPEKDGEADVKLIADFHFFPDRADLPLLTYGYVGAVPA